MTQLKVSFDKKGEAVFTAGKHLKGKNFRCFFFANENMRQYFSGTIELQFNEPRKINGKCV
jgi:hypothetical protein